MTTTTQKKTTRTELLEISISSDEDGSPSCEFIFADRRLIIGSDKGREYWAIAVLPPNSHLSGSGYVDESMSLADAFFRALGG